MLEAEDIAKILASNTLDIPGDKTRANETAKIIAKGQSEIYERLFGAMLRVVSASDKQKDSIIRELADDTAQALKKWPPEILAKDKLNANGNQVTSILPVLHPDYITIVIKEIETFPKQLASINNVIAGLLVELSNRKVLRRGTFNDLDADIFAAVIDYKIVKWAAERNDREEGTLGGTFGRLSLEIDSAKVTLAKLVDEQKDQTIQIDAQIKQLESDKAKLEATIQQLKETVSGRHAEIETQLVGFQNATEAKLKLHLLGNLWSHRAKNAFWSMIGSAVLSAALCVAGMIVVYWCGRDILSFVAPRDAIGVILGNNATAAIGHQIGRVLLVSVPVILYFWMIKMAVRFLVRSMLIYDDSSQRQTIMESYTLLVREGMDDDRALPMLLWAIFRQVPGHGSDGIEPPDFTEVINAGMKQGFGANKP